MGKRIIVRTLVNVSYAGNVFDNTLFDEEGILLKPHPKFNMKIFIPKDEIKEICVDGNIISYDEFTKN